jgi:hypothetical protein
MVLRESDPQTTIWELLPPEEAKRLPAELVQVDAYLDDERFIAPWRALFSTRLGRPSVPIDTLLRLLYRKHRYQLGYETGHRCIEPEGAEEARRGGGSPHWESAQSSSNRSIWAM